MIANPEIQALGPLLHSFAIDARKKIEAIPEDINVVEECRLIDAASAAPVAIAMRIVAISATLADDLEIKERAQSWLDGTYWRKA